VANGTKWGVGVGSGEAAKEAADRLSREPDRRETASPHFKKEAALWEEHERTLVEKLAAWSVKRAASFTAEDVGRRRQAERAAKGIDKA